MHYYKKIFFIFAAAMLLGAFNASALSRAVLQSLSPLQPVPANVRPNVSGNINSHVSQSQAPQTGSNGNNPFGSFPATSTNQASTNNPGNVTAGKVAGNYWWLYLLITFALALGAYFILKKKGYFKFKQ